MSKSTKIQKIVAAALPSTCQFNIRVPCQVGNVKLSFTSLTLVGSSLTHRHQTRPERLVRNKHSSLLRILVNCGHKKFCKIGPSVKHCSLQQQTLSLASACKRELNSVSHAINSLNWIQVKTACTVISLIRCYLLKFVEGSSKLSL